METHSSSGKRRLSLAAGLLGLVVVAALVVLVAQLRNRAGSTPTGAETQRILRTGTFNAWKYIAWQDEFGPTITIDYDKSSAGALRSYADANQKMASQLASQGGKAYIFVTFRALLDPNLFRGWARSWKMQVEEAYLRAGTGSQRGTHGIFGTPDDPLPKDALNRAGDPGDIGVYAVQGTVDAVALPTIAHDPRVFLCDVTPEMARRELVAAGISAGATAHVLLELPFWDMENMGLGNFALTPGPTPTGPVPTPVITVPPSIPVPRPVPSVAPTLTAQP